MKNRSWYKEEGITLVALVVTVIILLILAGITITLTLGDKGIINMAKEAGKNYQDAQEYEQALLGNLTNEATNIIGSNGTQGAGQDTGNIRILERGSFDFQLGSKDSITVVANLKNEYKLEDDAHFICYRSELVSGGDPTLAGISLRLQNNIDDNVYNSVEGKTVNLTIINNGRQSITFTYRIHYMVVTGIE